MHQPPTLSPLLRRAIEDPAIVEVALVAFGNPLYAGKNHKSVFEKAVASFLFYLPVFGKAGSFGLPRSFRALKSFSVKYAGRSRKPHPLSFWQAFDVDLAERGHPLMAIWALLAVHGHLCPGECMSLQRRDVVPPSIPVIGYWALLVVPSERSEQSKVGEADSSTVLDSKWAPSISHVGEGLHVKKDGRSVWNFTCPALVKEFQISFKRLGVQVVPYQRRHSGASHDRAVEARPLLVIRKR